MTRICSGDECVEHNYSENPLTYVRTNYNDHKICYVKEKEHTKNIAYKFVYVLELLLLKETNIDKLSDTFLAMRRNMRGLFSVILINQTRSEFKTRVTVGDLEPIWNQCFNRILHEFTIFGFLNLKLIDENHGKDPRTLKGSVVVNHTQICLPEDFGGVYLFEVECHKLGHSKYT